MLGSCRAQQPRRSGTMKRTRMLLVPGKQLGLSWDLTKREQLISFTSCKAWNCVSPSAVQSAGNFLKLPKSTNHRINRYWTSTISVSHLGWLNLTAFFQIGEVNLSRSWYFPPLELYLFFLLRYLYVSLCWSELPLEHTATWVSLKPLIWRRKRAQTSTLIVNHRHGEGQSNLHK